MNLYILNSIQNGSNSFGYPQALEIDFILIINHKNNIDLRLFIKLKIHQEF